MQLNDHASELEALHRERALAACLALHPKANQVSAEFCQSQDCQVSIPEARRIAVPGVQFCTRCQTQREKRERS